MITQVKVGQNYINVSVAITNNSGQRIDPTNAEAWFYKISQSDGSLTLDTNIGGTGKVILNKQDGQIGFYGAPINISSFLETEYVILYKITAEIAETITVEYLSIDLSKKQIGEIKIDTASIITTLSTLVSDIWNYTTRTLTSFGTLVASIWSYGTRTLTACIKGAEIDAIKERTDNLPDDPASESGALAKDATVAKEAQATLNKDEIIDAINDITIDLTNLETLIKRVFGLVQENFRITSTTYNASGLLTSATTKIYPTKADCDANTNAIATYLLTAVYDINNNCTSYKMTKE